MFQKLANSEGVGLQIEKILDDFTWNDTIMDQLPEENLNSLVIASAFRRGLLQVSK